MTLSTLRYDPIANAWETRAVIPTDREGLAVAADADGLIHAVGGKWGSTVMATHERYDPTTNAWTTGLPALPVARVGGAMAEIGGMLYFVGGSSVAGLTDASGRLFRFDPEANEWLERATMPTARSFLAVAVAEATLEGGELGDKLFAIGGQSAAAIELDACEVYDPDANQWEQRAPMLTAHTGVAAAVADNQIYVVSRGEDAHQVYDPDEDAWTVATDPTNERMYATYSAVGTDATPTGTLTVIGRKLRLHARKASR